MPNIPSRDEHEKRASKELFGDEDYVPMRPEGGFVLVEERTVKVKRWVTFNDLVAEYRRNA